jgi:hypothetical protein
MVAYALLIGTVLLGASSCARKIYFTDDARVKIASAENGESLLRELQFYTDDEILLRYRNVEKSMAPVDGVLQKKEAIQVKDIRIRRGTPCRLDSIDRYRNLLCLRFGLDPGEVLRFYKNRYDHYQIYADKWIGGRGNIKFQDQPFRIERQGNDCLLMVKNSEKYRQVTKVARAKGVRVNMDLETPIRDTIFEEPEEPELR